MDWGSHIVLASKLLGSCGLDRGAAIYSNLPAIDSKPAHFHRVYAHILENLPVILDAGIDVFNGSEYKDYKSYQEEYAYTRIRGEYDEFLKLTREGSVLLDDDSVAIISSDKMSAAVSLVSHLFFDLFNNPVQAFLPYNSRPSAQWDFWDSIDYMKFRGEFYNEENIIDFRIRIAESNVWDGDYSPAKMIKAMIVRIGEMAEPSITYEVVDNAVRKFLRYMDINEYLRIDKELAFCHRVEKNIVEIISERFGQ